MDSLPSRPSTLTSLTHSQHQEFLQLLKAINSKRESAGLKKNIYLDCQEFIDNVKNHNYPDLSWLRDKEFKLPTRPSSPVPEFAKPLDRPKPEEKPTLKNPEDEEVEYDQPLLPDHV
jgi:hypothetical protein